MLEVEERGGIRVLTSDRLRREWGIALAFSGRTGGVSVDPHESLNLSYNVGDDRSRVTLNRNRMGVALGVPPGSWTMCRQVHGATVGEAGPLEKGRGGLDHLSGTPRTDALVTATPGIAVGVLTADCLPLVLVAPRERCVAAVHSGWRGTLAGVAERALGRLMRLSSCPPEEVVAFAGPHIGRCCMEVDEAVAGGFRRKFGDGVVVSGRAGRDYLDLGAACRGQLEDAGVPAESIFLSGVCTCCGEGYFSYRSSSGVTGRQVGIVAVL